MISYSELKTKEVINVRDGCKYGSVSDLEIEEESGRIISIIVTDPPKLFGLFGEEEEYKIHWKHIICIGDDAILVDVSSCSC